MTSNPTRGVGLAEIRRLAAQPAWRRWTLASFLARLPLTMTLLALVLAGEAVTGSLAVGAQLAGAATLTAAVAAPIRGRRLDRRELRGGLRRACLMTGVVVTGQAVAVLVSAPLVVLFGLAIAQGVAMSAVSGGFRALLIAVVPGTDLARANSVEAVSIEIGFIAGPAFAGIIALVGGAPAALAVMAAVSFSAALLAGRLPRFEPPPLGPTAAPWRVPVAVAVYGIALALGLAVGVFEASLPARADELGQAAASAGPLLALTAVGSALGGVVASLIRDPRGRFRRRAVLLLAAFGLLLAPLGLVGSIPALAFVLFACGIPIAPLNALGALRLQEAIPPGRQGEGFAVYVASILLGIGIGQSIAGAALHVVGAQVLLLATGAPPVVAAVAVLVGSLVLRRRAAGRPAVRTGG